ncbi:MAG: RNA polymerase sigma factor [Rhodanobacteraceae bacterium]
MPTSSTRVHEPRLDARASRIDVITRGAMAGTRQIGLLYHPRTMSANKRVGGSPPREAPVGMHHVGAPANGERFGRFVHQQYGELLRFLRRRTGGAEDVQDLAQESIAKLLRYRETTPASDWRRLLYRIAINTACDRFRVVRHAEVVARASVQSHRCDADPRSPDEFAVRQRRLVQLRRGILALPPKCRRVFLLKVGQDMSNAEIARHCGISVKMVEKHLAKGLEALRCKVGDSAGNPFR